MTIDAFRTTLLKIPTGKLRILVSIALSVFVVLMSALSNYQPSLEVLGFLLIQQGLDIGQYMIKRNYPIPELPEKENAPCETDSEVG